MVDRAFWCPGGPPVWDGLRWPDFYSIRVDDLLSWAGVTPAQGRGSIRDGRDRARDRGGYRVRIFPDIYHVDVCVQDRGRRGFGCLIFSEAGRVKAMAD